MLNKLNIKSLEEYWNGNPDKCDPDIEDTAMIAGITGTITDMLNRVH